MKSIERLNEFATRLWIRRQFTRENGKKKEHGWRTGCWLTVSRKSKV